MRLLPWAYVGALAAGLAYAWRSRRGSQASADQDLVKLRELGRLGLDLEQPQDVAFTLILWTESSARQLAAELDRLGFRTAVEQYGADGEWECVAVREMRVTLEALRECRRRFQALTGIEGGEYEGWELGYEPSDSSA